MKEPVVRIAGEEIALPDRSKPDAFGKAHRYVERIKERKRTIKQRRMKERRANKN